MAQSVICGLPAGLRGMLDELAAVDTANAADSQAWILDLLQRHGRGIVNTLWRMLGREQDVLDAYQNTVCQMAARGPEHVGENRAAYFYRSAINAATEMIRRRRREQGHLPRVAEHCARRSAAAGVPAGLEHFQVVDRLRSAILQLPAQLRDVIVLRDLSGLNYRRISQIMNISAGTARVYRRQAVLRLAARLAKET